MRATSDSPSSVGYRARYHSTPTGSPASRRRARSVRSRARKAPGRASGSSRRNAIGSGRMSGAARQAASKRRARPTTSGEATSSQVRPRAIELIGSILQLILDVGPVPQVFQGPTDGPLAQSQPLADLPAGEALDLQLQDLPPVG